MKITSIAFFFLLLLILLLPLLLLLLRSRAHTTNAVVLQDFCVADLNSDVEVNGFACKPTAAVTETDFSSTALVSPAVVDENPTGSFATAADVETIPGLNTLGLSMLRVDYAAGGLNPPHLHPRATEMVFVLEGQLDVGFVTTANKLVSKTITTGEVFVFPRGLVHFQKNNAAFPAAVIAAFNGQLPGSEHVAAAIFGSKPSVPDGVIATAFGIGNEEVEEIKSRFAD